MFCAVAYLADRQRRFEQRLVSDTRRFAEEVAAEQFKWAAATVKQIETAMGGPR
jgi:hypothetical protein